MKYISLIGFMQMYGNKIKNEKRMLNLNGFMKEGTFVSEIDYAPFTINYDCPELYDILINRSLIQNRYGYINSNLPLSFIMPPIIELEWMMTQMVMSDEVKDALYQMSYIMIVHMLYEYQPYQFAQDGSAADAEFWMNCLEQGSALVEVETLDDALAVLSEIELPNVNLPQIRSYISYQPYSPSCYEMICQCAMQRDTFAVVYSSLPIILSMFMTDYSANRLKYWTSDHKITLKKKLEEILDVISRIYMVDCDEYTYNRTTEMTRKDVELIRIVFTGIWDRVDEINKNIGMVSYWGYQHIATPESRATVILSEIPVTWDAEMERVRAEKEKGD